MLRLRDVSVARGGRFLLKGLALDLRAGQVCTLRGPNGIGKTTLLRTIAGFQNPQAGTIETAPCIYTGHLDGVKAMLTVRENLSFWARVFGETSIETALQAFELTALADRMAGRLSAGQKRRLGLARLLLSDAPLWLLDEPTVALDSASVAVFEEVLARHTAKGGAALVSTHLALAADHTLDLTPFKADPKPIKSFDEAFV